MRHQALMVGGMLLSAACTAGQITKNTSPVGDTQVHFITCDPAAKIGPARTVSTGLFGLNPYDPTTSAIHREQLVPEGDTLISTFDPKTPGVVYTQYVNHVYDQTCNVTYAGTTQPEQCKIYSLEQTNMSVDDSACQKFNAACAAKGFAPAYCPADFYRAPAASTAPPTIGAASPIAGNQYGEAVIAMDPNNADHLVATGIDYTQPPGGGAYYSWNGGQSWAVATIHGQAGTSFTNNTVYSMPLGDPNLDLDTHGNVYIVAWTQNDTVPNARGILLYKSTDGGRTYDVVGTPALLSIAYDDGNPDPSKPPITSQSANPLTQDSKGNLIYINDGPHVRIDKSVDPNVIYVEFAAQTYASSADFVAKRPPVDSGTLVARSSDGGATFTRILQHIGGNGWIGPNGQDYELSPPNLYVSTDGAQTYQTLPAWNQNDSWYGWGNWGWTGFVVDSWPMSPNKGALYSAYGNVGRDSGDILFRSSTDGGKTWSAPVTVNDDPPAATCNGDTPQFLANVNVAPNGRIDVIWYDRRNDPYASNCDAQTSPPPWCKDADPSCDHSSNTHYADVYYAYSLDGGKHFSANLRLTKTPMESAGDYIWVSSGATRAVAVYSQYQAGVSPFTSNGRTLYSSTIDFH